MKRSDKKAQQWAKEFVDGLPTDVLKTVQRKPERLTCACQNRTKGKPHRPPCPLVGKYAGRKQPSKPMTTKQVEQRKAFDARRIVPPKSIAAEVKAIIAHVTEHPCEGKQVAQRLRDVFPLAFRNQK